MISSLLGKIGAPWWMAIVGSLCLASFGAGFRLGDDRGQIEALKLKVTLAEQAKRQVDEDLVAERLRAKHIADNLRDLDARFKDITERLATREEAFDAYRKEIEGRPPVDACILSDDDAAALRRLRGGAQAPGPGNQRAAPAPKLVRPQEAPAAPKGR